jgi:hypothetical protein
VRVFSGKDNRVLCETVMAEPESSFRRPPIPCREGEPAPGPDYIRGELMDNDGKSLRLHWIPRDELKTGGPLRHENIDSLLPAMRWTWRHLRKRITSCSSFEQWERGFLQDMHPAREVAHWMKLTYAFLEFCHREPRADPQGIFRYLCEQGLRDVETRPRSVGPKLKRLYANPPKVLRSLENFTEDGHLKTRENHLR